MADRRTGLLNFLLGLGLFSVASTVSGCGYPGSPSHSTIVFSDNVISEGTVAMYVCDDGFELLGPSRRTCANNGTWMPPGIPFCVLNVAAGKAPMQSSVLSGGVPQKAVDGSTSSFFTPDTCARTDVERSPWWYVNLLEPYMVQLVRLDFGQSSVKNQPTTVVVRVGNSRPDLGTNPICNRFTGPVEEGRPLFLPCNPPMPGAFVSIHLEGPTGQSLSICEAFVYTDQALPMERCPQFRDQAPGSSATYNGKCYLFYNEQPLSFDEAQDFCQSRGGSLVDETSPALQGFLSWELWRRHRGDPNGQFWMGAFRDPKERNNWKWLSGRDVTISFWNLPGGNDDCARFDGTKGWLWSDTNCNLKLHFICQHKPKSCGRPEQPPNATIITEDFNIGTKIEYKCDKGHLLVGPSQRTCLASGFFNEFPPVCKHLQCGLPARIPNGFYSLLNGTRDYLSTVSYSCDPGFVLVGRGDLICDVDERWNGPPPRCDPAFCPDPPAVPNAIYRLSTNTTVIGTIVEYSCMGRSNLVGPKRIKCTKNGRYNRDPPYCEEIAPVSAQRPPSNAIRRIDQDMSESMDHPFENPFPRVPQLPGTRPKSGPRLSPRPAATQPPPADETDQHAGSHPDFQPPFEQPTERRVDDTKAYVEREPRPAERQPTERRTERPTNPDRTLFRKGPYERVDDDVSIIPVTGNEVDTANVRSQAPPNANEPRNKVAKEEVATGRLNIGGIVALGVFGGFVFLAAVITTAVIIARRVQTGSRYRKRGSSSDSHGSSSASTSDNRALSKFYQKAWDDLQGSSKGGLPRLPDGGTTRSHVHSSRRDEDFRSTRVPSEVMRDDGEMVVADVHMQKEKKRHHHHHHHHKRGKKEEGSSRDWSGDRGGKRF